MNPTPRHEVLPPSSTDPPPYVLRFGIADRSGRIISLITTTSLMDTVRMFERMARAGFVPGPGRRHAGAHLLKVFVDRDRD